MKMGAFADMQKKKMESLFIIPNTPFSELFKEKPTAEKAAENMVELKNNENESQEKNGNSTTDNLTTKLNSLTMVSTNDDFIMVDLVILIIFFCNVCIGNFKLEKFDSRFFYFCKV